MADEITQNTEETTTVETTTTEVETKDEAKAEVVLSDEQKAAVNLFNSLKDPKTAGATLQALAEMGGFNLQRREDRKEIKKTVSALIAEKLGEDHSLLSERLGPALEEIIDSAVNEKLKPFNDKITEREQTELQSHIDQAFVDLETETKGLSKKLEGKMVQLMDVISPGKDTKPRDYIRYIYKLAKSDFDEAEAIKAQNTQRDKNKRVPGVHSEVNPDRVKSGSKLPTIKEAVAAAMRGETLE